LRDHHAVYAGLGRACARTLVQRAKRLTHLRCIAHTDDHAADLALVRNVGRGDFQHHGVADFLCHAYCLVFAHGHALLHHGDTRTREHRLGFDLVHDLRGRRQRGEGGAAMGVQFRMSWKACFTASFPKNEG